MNNFKEYGFEADFEGEILKEVDGIYVGWVKSAKLVQGCSWDKLGNAKCDINWGEYCLTPIKKEWYEVESNFPCLIVSSSGGGVWVHYGLKDRVFDYRNNGYDIVDGGWRLATNEEIDKLKVKQ